MDLNLSICNYVASTAYPGTVLVFSIFTTVTVPLRLLEQGSWARVD